MNLVAGIESIFYKTGNASFEQYFGFILEGTGLVTLNRGPNYSASNRLISAAARLSAESGESALYIAASTACSICSSMATQFGNTGVDRAA